MINLSVKVILNLFCYSRISLTDEITLPEYSYFLCFSVKVRTNKFVYFPIEKYTPEQQKLYDKIKQLHDNGMSYRRITKYLNKNKILTPNGNKWGVSGNSVYSVLKRYKEREERIEYLNREYEPDWSKMKVVCEKNEIN